MGLERYGLDAVSRLAVQVRGPTLRFPAGPGRVVAAARRRVVRLPEVRWADPVTVPALPALPALARRVAQATPAPPRAVVAEPARLSTSVPVCRAPVDPVRAVGRARSDPVRAARAAVAMPEAIEGVDRVLLRIGLAPGAPNLAVSEPVAMRPMPDAADPDAAPGLPSAAVPPTPEPAPAPVRARDVFAPGPRIVAGRDPVRPTPAMAAASDPVRPTVLIATFNPVLPTAAGAIRPVALGGPAAPRMPDLLPSRPAPSQPIAPRSARPVPPASEAGDAEETPDATPAASASSGAVLLDGQLVGQGLWDRMARDAERPPAGLTGFDVRRAPAWSLG